MRTEEEAALVQECPLASRRARFLKRTIDLAIAIPVSLVALLVLPFIALAVRLDSPGGVVFRQERVGRGGRRIRLLKLRSMHADAEERLRSDPDLYKLFLAHDFKIPDGQDPRVTRVGRWLRRTSLDELPQIFQVLTGSLSLVGPRPIEPAQVSLLYEDDACLYLSVKPGLTGMWQVSGRSEVRRGPRRTLDCLYVKHWSVVLDLRLIIRTIPAVLTARGAH